MYLNVALAILTIGSLVFGTWTYFRKRVPGRLTAYVGSVFSLVDEVAKDLDILDIWVDGSLVENDVFFFSGFFINDGRRDITPEMAHSLLKLQVGSTCRLLDFAVSSRNGNEVEIITTSPPQPSSAEIKLGLLKQGEAVDYRGLIEVPDGGDGSETLELNWDARIVDTDVRTLTRKDIPDRGVFELFLTSIVFGVLAAITTAVYGFILANQEAIAYEYVEEGQRVSVRMTKGGVFDSGKVNLIGLDSDYERELSSEDLNPGNLTYVGVREYTDWRDPILGPVAMVWTLAFIAFVRGLFRYPLTRLRARYD